MEGRETGPSDPSLVCRVLGGQVGYLAAVGWEARALPK